MKLTDAKDAISTGKINHHSRWGQGDFAAKDRLSNSIAIPNTNINVKLNSETKIFTIGSCFARNVEESLFQEGLNVLSKDIDVPFEVTAARNTGVINKYNPGTIFHELSWALGDESFNDDFFIEVDGKYIDLNLKPGEQAQNLAVVKSFRDNITTYFKQVQECDVVILTLGMIECWFDDKYKIVLNQPPHPKAIRKEPKRFKFCVLELEDILYYMRKSIELINKAGVKHIFITTSPVALARTFTSDDVITANCLSKSTLRVASNILVNEFSNVHYFPSYETVIYNNSNLCWESDWAHASEYVVSRIISEFVLRHVDGAKRKDFDEVVNAEPTELEIAKKLVSRYKLMLIKNNLL
jgi:hypothetical protein